MNTLQNVGEGMLVVGGDINITNKVDGVSKLEIDSLKKGLAKNTQKSYADALTSFTSRGFLVPATVVDVLTYIQMLVREIDENGDPCHTAATIKNRVAGISYHHRLAMMFNPNLINPCDNMSVAAELKGLREERSTMQKRALAIDIDQLNALVNKIDVDTKKGVRDKAMILLGYFATLRRSEVVNIKISEVSFIADGMMITIPRSKTDDNADTVAVPCKNNSKAACDAVRELLTVLKGDGIFEGDLFRSIGKSGLWGDSHIDAVNFNKILKDYATAAGLQGVTGHSLRAGSVTVMAKTKSLHVIQQHGRWKSSDMLIDRYIRPANKFESSPWN